MELITYHSDKKRSDFEKWYETVENDVFNFQEQIKSYCWSDVVVLAEGCLAFRKIIIDRTKKTENDVGVDPFLSSITIASLCHFIFRRNLLKPDTIGIIPENGYHPEQKTSIKCQLWLKYLSHTYKIKIQHCKNSGEKAVGDYLIDGFCEETNTYYEFHGCYFHGCPKCVSSQRSGLVKIVGTRV